MTTNTVSIRRMNRKDVNVAITWAGLEGWNPGLHDADSFFAADSQGYFMAESDGKMAGCISAVAYDDNFGFMGFYIVRPELRGRGIGMALFQTALAYMGDRVIGGDGVVAMLDKYAQVGFRIAHYNARYEGRGEFSASTRLADLGDVSLTELEHYDRRFFPAPRQAFLRNWVTQRDSHFRAVLDKGRLAGYGVIRPCQRGFKIGPLFADTPDLAADLFRGLVGLAPEKSVFLDIPVCNQAACDLVAQHSMRRVFETARIYRGTPPELPLEQIFGITSFELG